MHVWIICVWTVAGIGCMTVCYLTLCLCNKAAESSADYEDV